MTPKTPFNRCIAAEFNYTLPLARQANHTSTERRAGQAAAGALISQKLNAALIRLQSTAAHWLPHTDWMYNNMHCSEEC